MSEVQHDQPLADNYDGDRDDIPDSLEEQWATNAEHARLHRSQEMARRAPAPAAPTGPSPVI